MKWALVVYFMTASGWQSAENIGKDKVGWSSIEYDSYQECISKAKDFNSFRASLTESANKMKAKCERVEKTT